MKPEQLNLVCFSPTGTTLKVLNAIESSLSFDKTRLIDLTLKDFNNKDASAISADLTLIGLPVYSGRLPLEGLERFKQIKGNGAPAVLVVVYGNRHYDDALLELHNLAVEQGFKPVAAAAFIGEHTFSTEEKPLGVNRPDALDVEQAHIFAERIQQNLESSDLVQNITVPGNTPLKERGKLPPLSPETKAENCDQCGICVDVCPTQAISINGSVNTDVEACIWCCACVKACPSDARYFENDTIAAVREKLYTNCKERREPEFFI